MKKTLEGFGLQVYGLPAEVFWSLGQLGMIVLNYLMHKVQHTMPVHCHNAENVVWGTIKGWQLTLTWVNAKYAHEGCKQLAETGLYAHIYQHSTYLLKTFKLEQIDQHSAHFGCFEICCMLEYFVTTTQELDVLLQHHVMINLEFTLGVRPSPTGWSYLEWKKERKYLKLKVSAHLTAYATWQTDIIWKHLKGFNLIKAKQGTAYLLMGCVKGLKCAV
ncbi:hypothetical protein K439DRAFT_1614569 [Ramaria rubella]|nr:hypothetical protein K439DRAFT_1614569 [Ramaria rubella]